MSRLSWRSLGKQNHQRTKEKEKIKTKIKEGKGKESSELSMTDGNACFKFWFLERGKRVFVLEGNIVVSFIRKIVLPFSFHQTQVKEANVNTNNHKHSQANQSKVGG